MPVELFDQEGRSVGWTVSVLPGRLRRVPDAIRAAGEEIGLDPRDQPGSVQVFISRAGIARLSGDDLDLVDHAPWVSEFQRIIMAPSARAALQGKPPPVRREPRRRLRIFIPEPADLR